jgi:hypothetical protein
MGIFLRVIRAALAFMVSTACADTLWRQYGFTPSHTSFNDSETILTRGNVSHLVLLWSENIEPAIGSAPI